MIDLLNRFVPAETIEIPQGSGGMFLWVRLKVESHPDFPKKVCSLLVSSSFAQSRRKKSRPKCSSA